MKAFEEWAESLPLPVFIVGASIVGAWMVCASAGVLLVLKTAFN